MADTNVSQPTPSAHIQESIRSIDRLHAEHRQDATPLQRAVDRMTNVLGRPGFIGVVTMIVVVWVSFNLLAAALGFRAIDPPPFSGLAGATSLTSLYMVVLIWPPSGGEDLLARHYEHSSRNWRYWASRRRQK
jgi:uncharacterized membrane protein